MAMTKGWALWATWAVSSAVQLSPPASVTVSRPAERLSQRAALQLAAQPLYRRGVLCRRPDSICGQLLNRLGQHLRIHDTVEEPP